MKIYKKRCKKSASSHHTQTGYISQLDCLCSSLCSKASWDKHLLCFTGSYQSYYTTLVRFSKFGNCLQNIRGVYPKRPWNIVISTNNLAGLYTQSVCDKNLRIYCIFFHRFSHMASTVGTVHN